MKKNKEYYEDKDAKEYCKHAELHQCRFCDHLEFCDFKDNDELFF